MDSKGKGPRKKRDLSRPFFSIPEPDENVLEMALPESSESIALTIYKLLANPLSVDLRKKIKLHTSKGKTKRIRSIEQLKEGKSRYRLQKHRTGTRFMAPPVTKLQALFTAAAVLLALAPAPAAALVPYGGATGLWLDDPFRVLEQTPLPRPAPSAGAAAVALARCDWKETPEAHVISVDVPGVRRGDVKVEVEENRVLRVSGERRPEPEREEGGERWHRAKRAAGRFWRRFRLPAGADMGRVAARLEDGVLTVTVPKVAGHRGKEPRVVSIAGGQDEGAAVAGKGAAAEVEATKAEV